MLRLFLSTFFLVFLCQSIVVAQQLDNIPMDQATIDRELKRRGLTEAEVRVKFEEKGIDLNNVTADQLPQLEATLDEIVKEIEAEKRAIENVAQDAEAEKIIEEEAKTIAKDAGGKIQEAVEDGATVEEAIAEELVDQIQVEIPPTRIYGQEIFRNKTLKVFSQSDDVAPSSSYILGPGDKVNVSIWGISQEDATYEINQAGFIKPTGMSKITLKGISYEKAKELLKSRFSQSYRFRAEEFAVTISYARTINVNIYGEVFNTGSFTIPATNTAFNALVAAGGPTDIGSVRNIKLIRNNGGTQQMDVYEFMNNPTVSENFQLSNNDIIHVSIAEKVVEIKGAIRRPLKYELLATEQLKSLLDYAGGLKENAYRTTIQVKRFENDEERIIDVKLGELMRGSSDFTLLNGDIVTIPVIPTSYENFAKIEGAVELPGEFEITKGMRVSDLLKKAVLARDARTDLAYLVRVREDGTASYERVNIAEVLTNPSAESNYLLTDRDRLNVLSQKTYVDQNLISTSGQVRNPQEIQYDPAQSIKVADAIVLSGGLKPEATDFAYIRRQVLSDERETEYIRINLVEALSNASSGDNLELKANDRLIIYSKLDFLEKSTVSVSGAVRSPGEFTYDASLTLTDLLTLAGGLKMQAATNRIDVFRVQIFENEATKTIVATLEVDGNNFQVDGSNFVLQPFDQVAVRSVANFELQQLVTLRGEVKFPGVYALIDDNERLASVIKRAGGLTKEAFAEGAILERENGENDYIVFQLEEALQNSSSNSNLIMRRGDVLDIPKQKDLVEIELLNTLVDQLYDSSSVVGRKDIKVPYTEGKSAKYYIDKYAAGIGENGRRKYVTVLHPSGEIQRTKSFLFFKKYPTVEKGSVVRVGRKKESPVKERKKKENTDWGKVVANSIAQVTAVLTLVLLTQRLD